MATANDEWYDEEVIGAEFGDKRLATRFGKLLGGLSQKSELSIPGALDSWSETYAAYRFFSNKKVTAEGILLPHKEATLKRIEKESVALLPQDTSEMNFSSKTDIEGLGPLNTEHHQGFLFHPVLAITPERLCLGSLSNEMWVRDSIGDKGPNHDRKIEDKESLRWIKGFQIAEEAARKAPNTLVVSIADREGDIYEFFQTTAGVREGAGAHWLIRSTYNRVASKKEYGEKQGLFFKVLKSGCNIERLQLEHVDRLFKCLTLYMIVAWRIMYIRSLGQKYPEESCTLIFSENEWKSVYCRLNKRKALPQKPPSLREMVVWVARLGGFLARKNDGNPGIKTLWIGIQRMHDYAQA
jgi:transposase-like protein/transposase Tn5 family protein